MIRPSVLHQLIYDHVYLRYGQRIAFTVRALLNAKEREIAATVTDALQPSALEYLIMAGFVASDKDYIRSLAQTETSLLATLCALDQTAKLSFTTQNTPASSAVFGSGDTPAGKMVSEGKMDLKQACLTGSTMTLIEKHDGDLAIRSLPMPAQPENERSHYLEAPKETIPCEFKPLDPICQKYHEFVATENVLTHGKLGPTPFSYFYDHKLRVDNGKTRYTMYPACHDHWKKRKPEEESDEYSHPDDAGRIVYAYDYDNDNILSSTFEAELRSLAQAMQEMGNPLFAEVDPSGRPDVALVDTTASLQATIPTTAIVEPTPVQNPTEATDPEAVLEEVHVATTDDEGADGDEDVSYVPVGDDMDPDLAASHRVIARPKDSTPERAQDTSAQPYVEFQKHIDKKIQETERAVTPYIVSRRTISNPATNRQYVITDDCMRADVLQKIYRGEERSRSLVDLVGYYNIPLYYGLYSEFKGLSEIRFKKGAVIAGRYEIYRTIFEDSAFSITLRARDLRENKDVCLKVVNNEKDTLDQCLNEIRLLTYINRHDPTGKHFVRMTDYFYYGHRLIIIFELLGSNLFSYYSEREPSLPKNMLNPLTHIFTMPRLQHITRQILESLDFLHRLSILHLDLKHENLLLVNDDDDSFDIRLVDIGSSAFLFDEVSVYVQSRSYRCPEVILGLPYDGRADVWSVGPILTELITGKVMFPIPQRPDEDHKPYASMLARLVGIIGPIPREMILAGRDSHRFFTKDLFLFESRAAILGNRDRTEGLRYVELKDEDFVYILPKKTSVRAILGWDSHPEECDEEFLDFIETVMRIDPRTRPTAAEALQHPWLKKKY
ncbi:Kinase, CMGC DYRK [Giardia muris]|uniref:Kinase, CMGC DYRK n=1 Tax=Giardia muris TaxID=5742 RepID=A0A4Z1SUX2_GIAMU|nr:Kinase, CMGC DYRK [Giardia muris]|eukprot:TNJ29636.1 Kinase, CMGC DYRK [Giardia muris]